MNNYKMGQFICKARKSRNMTQKELADKLHITDKAVSKWERGISCPDFSLLMDISDVLGVKIGELLNGEKSKDSYNNDDKNCKQVLRFAQQSSNDRLKMWHNIAAFGFSAILFIGLIVSVICNIAISRQLTWSLYPIVSIVFVWCSFYPTVKFGCKGIIPSIIILDVLIFPYLYILDKLITATDLLFPIGTVMSVIGIVFIWCVLLVFRIFKSRKFIGSGIVCLIAIPFQLIINFALSKFITEPVFDIWDIFTDLIIIFIAIAFFIVDYIIKRKYKS